MAITRILLFYLLISLITCINPFSGCLNYLEASQVIYKANQLTGLSVMEISTEKNFRAICKIIFAVKRIILSLPVLRLALIFLICMFYGIFMLYCFSTLVLANLVGKMFCRFACFDVISWSVFDHSFVDWKESYS